jgi:hypothetical protein
MGSLADHVAAGGTLPRTKADIENIAACRCGDASVRVRLDAASPTHDGLYWFDSEGAAVIVSRGWGSPPPRKGKKRR